jgi:hypothetical protein
MMTKRIFNHTLLLSLPMLALACNQPSPPGSDEAESSEGDTSTTGTDTGGTETSGTETTGTETDEATDTTDTGVVDDSLYPLVDGASWTYVVTNTMGQVLGMETIDVTETVWNGGQAWEWVDSPNANGNWSVSTIVRDGDLVLRVHREEMGQLGVTALLDYEPGFARANDAWTSVGFTEELLYDRTAYDALGQNPVVEARGHTYEVMAIDEPVTVPAGTFDCVKVERVRTLGAEAGSLAWFWFAPGVGKVREERPVEMEIEELASVSIPGGASFP